MKKIIQNKIFKFRRSRNKQKTERKTIATPQESLEVVNDYDMPEVGMEEEIICVNAGICFYTLKLLPTTFTLLIFY